MAWCLKNIETIPDYKATLRVIHFCLDDRDGYHPSEWIKGDGTLKKPEHVW